MGYVFVSYSRWDRKSNPLIERILSDLRAAGVELWLSPDSVPAGTDFSTAIDAALESASALLLLSGPRALKAKGLMRELDLATQRGLPIFLATINEGGAFLEDQAVFLFAVDYERALQTLIQALPAEVKPSPLRRRAESVTTTPKSKGYVFISYADEDSEFVMKMRLFMKDRGFGYWDYQDSDRNYHTQLFLELEEVIRGAAAMISVLSPDWKQSRWAAKEYIFSEDVGVPVFLAMAREMGPTLVIAGIPYIDFTRDMDAGFAKLDKELRKKGLV
ncbi:MAG: toll/interleukin-1 receptor domain-containing protein [Chloroflexota bacterium]|nr:toll/interleukin-1 receptor domain-containing protein [Chloroflexota bacterium]